MEPEKEVQLTLYKTLVPILGSVIITLNFAVVISSGLILKRGTHCHNYNIQIFIKL